MNMYTPQNFNKKKGHEYYTFTGKTNKKFNATKKHHHCKMLVEAVGK